MLIKHNIWLSVFLSQSQCFLLLKHHSYEGRSVLLFQYVVLLQYLIYHQMLIYFNANKFILLCVISPQDPPRQDILNHEKSHKRAGFSDKWSPECSAPSSSPPLASTLASYHVLFFLFILIFIGCTQKCQICSSKGNKD